MARLPLKQSTIKKLFALSGNICAYPDCQENLIDTNNTIIGEICHIEAAEFNGQRYNPDSNDEYRRSLENLILLCGKHHKVTNNVKKYSVYDMKQIKNNHEKKFQSKPFIISSDLTDKIIDKYIALQNIMSEPGTKINNLAHAQHINSQIGSQHYTYNYFNNPDDKVEHHMIGIRKVISELKCLINVQKKKASPPSKDVIDYQNELSERFERDIELVPINLLKFRKDNGRIKADVESYERSKQITLDEKDEHTQNLLRTFLIKNDPEKNETLKNLLIQKGQLHPAIITCDGFLINGNRRKAILDMLYQESNQNSKYENMRVIILPENITELDIQKIENRYQLQEEGKSEYHGLNRALTLRSNIEKGFTLEAQLRDDPKFSDKDEKTFAKEVKKIEAEYLKPLKCVDRYLETFKKEGLYNTISESAGDKEGRWQAFKDYSIFYNQYLANEAKRIELGLQEEEVRKIENAIFKIIRKRNLNSKELEKTLGKLHAFVRSGNLKKYLSNSTAKEHIINIAIEVKEDIPDVEKYDKDGNKYNEREIDEKWGSHFRQEIFNNLMKANKAVYNQQESDKPLELLEDTLKKLKHNNLKIENIDPADFSKALNLAKQIISKAESIYEQIDKKRYTRKYKK